MSQEISDSRIFLTPRKELTGSRLTNTKILCALFFILLAVGLINLYSASFEAGFFRSQMKNLPVTLTAFFLLGWVIPIKKVSDFAYWLFFVVALCLLAVDLVGKNVNGSQRWLELGPITFQPSEFAKVTIAISVARFFASNPQHTPYTLKDLIPVIGQIAIIFGLIYAQPDLGTAGVCLMIATAQILFIPIDVRSFRKILFMVPIALTIIWLRLHSYQKLRVLNFFNPDYDPSNTGYQSVQSIVAVGSGGLFGKGYMEGTQVHLRFLPERHTDFIFSVFAEEHGFWKSCLVFALFTAISYMALVIARQSRDTFNGVLAIGVGALLFIEFVINVSMGMGMFPVVGIPLPFFSFGSSAMLTVCVSVGLLIGIDRANSRAVSKGILIK